ncbi:MAG: sigma-70 family RNA polymerase sigma factor [Phycisphaerales bacterium]|nr:sigma-70 family RNA polymerase sigma factor [Phycisphaerales bacterium]MCB9858688.1 sigma-70 family RNA polymerase sigma factor [Phycisphaerales bacterium]MCB9864456.1 sigma-70 family RNA polymerase sigma factor [Phycisphaerales bacterium]
MKRLASRLLRKYGTDARRTTSLVHDAYLRMIHADDISDYTTRRLLGVAAHAMRSVLIDNARRRQVAKRGVAADHVPLAEWNIAAAMPDETLLRLNESLVRLQAMDVRKARIVELRYFGGLSNLEASQVLGVSTATVKRDWAFARAWLFHELTSD